MSFLWGDLLDTRVIYTLKNHEKAQERSVLFVLLLKVFFLIWVLLKKTES